jgi:hypothetical protein
MTTLLITYVSCFCGSVFLTGLAYRRNTWRP